jgi:DNA-directed RNA polymerase subunit RPC12/RpoP
MPPGLVGTDDVFLKQNCLGIGRRDPLVTTSGTGQRKRTGTRVAWRPIPRPGCTAATPSVYERKPETIRLITRRTKMEILLKFQCQSCDKEFTVLNEQVETDMLSCPHCQESVDVGDEEPEVEYED